MLSEWTHMKFLMRAAAFFRNRHNRWMSIVNVLSLLLLLSLFLEWSKSIKNNFTLWIGHLNPVPRDRQLNSLQSNVDILFITEKRKMISSNLLTSNSTTLASNLLQSILRDPFTYQATLWILDVEAERLRGVTFILYLCDDGK